MKKRDLVSARFFVGLGGGEVRCVTQDGEIKFSYGISPGLHFPNAIDGYMAKDDHLEISGEITVLKSGGGRVKCQRYGPRGNESGANPDFRPTIYSEQQAQLQKLIGEVTKKTNRLDKRIETLTRLQEQQAVVDDEPEAQAQEPETPLQEPQEAAE